MGAIMEEGNPGGVVKIQIMSYYKDKSNKKPKSSSTVTPTRSHHHHNSTPPPRCRLPSISEKPECGYENKSLSSVVSITGIVVENSSSCSSFNIGDSCFVYPVKNLKSLEFMEISDLDSIFPFSEAPFNMVARIPVYGFPSMNIVESLIQYNSSSKIFILGDYNYVWWILNLLKVYDSQRLHIQGENIIVATSKDSDLSEIKRDFANIDVIQWNDDAYEEVLLDRTKDAIKGLADVVVNCQTNPRHLLRLFKCCKPTGDLIIGCALSNLARKKLINEERRILYCHQPEEESDPEDLYSQSEKICDLVSHIKLESDNTMRVC